MITQAPKTFHHASVDVKPSDLLLQKGSWVNFSPAWPQDNISGWCSGRAFEVSQDPIVTNYPISRIIPTGHYALIDLSNQVPPPTANYSLQMYPAQIGVVYQISIGMKKGDYFVQLYIPRNVYVYNVGSSAIFPDISDSTFKYLGAKYPDDSPDTSPTWNLYAINQMVAFVMAIYVDGPDFDKATINFQINKCPVTEIPQRVPGASGGMIANPVYTQAVKQGTLIQYQTEMQGF